jgi:hypothetical protein
MTTKTTLMEMAEAVGDEAFMLRGHVERWNRDHPDAPLGDDDQWSVRARTFAAAHLTLSLMALDEEASRKFVASLMASSDAKLMVAMLMPVKPKVAEAEAA